MVDEVPYVLMRRDLRDAIAEPAWPEGLSLTAFSQSRAAEAHALLKLAYADGGGAVPPFDEWWPRLSADSEYDPQLCFLVCDSGGRAAGFAQCWTTPFIKDFVVHPRHRRRGVGRALLLHIFRAFQERGAGAVDLKVHTGNPSAVPLYESLGMARISTGPAPGIDKA
jgi:ribosomal protein S18 acetylase RimI-like enzyme